MTRFALRRGSLAAAALVLLLGCQAETFGADDIVVDPATMVLEGTRLPGGTMTVTAPLLENAPLPVAIVIDGSRTVVATRSPASGSQFIFQLPQDLKPGSHILAIQAGGGASAFLSSINVGGFSEIRYVAGTLAGITQVVKDRPQLAGLIYGQGDCEDQIGILDLPSAQLLRPANGLVCGHFGIGTSWRPGAISIPLSFDANWRPAGTMLGRLVVDSAEMWGGTGVMHEIAPGIDLDAGKHWTNIWGPSVAEAQSATLWTGYLHSDHVAMTGDGAWAVPDHQNSDSGVLIIDRSNGAHHWSPYWGYARTAAGEGGEAFVLGFRTGGYGGEVPVWLGRINAATGVMTDSTLVRGPSGEPYATSYGRVYSLRSADYLVLVFAVGGESDPFQLGLVGGHWELSFRDPVTLAEVAHSRSPVEAAGCDLSDDPWLVEDPMAHRFYLTAADCSGRTPILTFELPE